MNRLEEFYEKYNTDKGNKPAFPELNRFGHEYGLFYQQYFEKFLGKKPSILEIGVFEGQSMLAHNEYFNKECTITGIDVENLLTFDCEQYSNIKVLFGNSEAEETYNKIKNEKFDIIIDDASHTYKNQLKNLLLYHTLLNTNGLYIIEDLQCNLEPRYSENSLYGIENSTLSFLLCKTKPCLYSYEEFYNLISKIKYVTFWSKTREVDHTDKDEKCSITSIITFND